ncbi:MAG: hypothetical protein Q8M51_12540 [Polaromonas sp.]|nr:hypothetical protein [Polaromonas sp.]
MPVTPPPICHHLVLPFAACSAADWLPAMKALPPAAFRNFNQLLQGMKPIHTDNGDERSLSPPHERVLARALNLPMTDGLIPWAAWQLLKNGGTPGEGAWALITPCHWAMGRDHATLTDPAALGLQEQDSRALLAAMQPYFATEGITLHYAEPTRWLAEGELFRMLPSASLDRVLGRNVEPWMPATRQIRLLQNEMQMLLYTHAVNDARAARKQAGINSFWISGTGALPDTFLPQSQPEATLAQDLAQAVFYDDWPLYTQAWSALDAGEGARLLALQQGGDTVRLSLCGERNALSFESTHTGLWAKVRNLFGHQPFVGVLEQL